MSYVNKSETLNQFQELVQQNFNRKLNYMPNSFNEQQRYALELFKKRIFLEEIIDETISFNNNLNWENKNNNLYLVATAEELIEVFKLRSIVYTELGYNKEFPDIIEGLNFDKYDKTSGIVYYKNNKEFTGTCRLIFDSKNKLPSEDKSCFNNMRSQYNSIGEISRNIVKHKSSGLNLEFKYLMAGMHNIFVNNNINMTLSVIKNEHFKLFSKFGGIDVEEELKGYGELNKEFLVISWDPSQASKFFKKAFLS